MTGNIFVQSWLIWATFHTTGEHFFHQKFPLLSSDLKNVLTKDFPVQPFPNVLQIRCYCKFPDNHKEYLCWSLLILKRSDEFYLSRFVWNEEIKQEPHKSYYRKIVPCKTALIQLEKDLYRRIYKREICKDVLW